MSISHSKLSEALAFHQQGQLAKAKTIYEEILTREPQQAYALYLLGVLYSQINNPLRAIQFISRAIDIDPTQADFHAGIGDVLQMTDQLQPAVDSYNRAIDLNPNLAITYFNRGLALQELRQLKAAVESYDRAISLQPTFSESYANRGNALQELKQLEAALESYNRALSFNPMSAETYFNRGNTFEQLKRLKAAVESYDRAIEIMPDFADAYNCRGNVLVKLKKYEEAIRDYKKTLSIKPDFHYLFGILFHIRMRICDWTDFDKNISEMIKHIEKGDKYSPGFPFLFLVDSLSVQKKAAQIFHGDKYPPDDSLGTIPKRPRSDKIRIGYFSADFHFHPVSVLLAEMFELHDRNKFELVAFSLRSDIKDEMQERLQRAFNQFVDVSHLPDQAVAKLVRDMNMDIVVDLGGATAESRTGIFSYRIAPIQVNYLGYPGTMSVEYIDYIFADPVIIPKVYQPFYAEKVVYLPSYQPSDTTRVISDKQFTRQELGLPDQGFVFCCFNDNYKITPMMWNSWMRILNAVSGSVLFLYANHETARNNLKHAAESAGVEANRLIFASRLKEYSEYLARYKAMDLFLDTFPYNAHATASDVLWAGLPLLTLTGETFASRVAASVLQAINVPELITHTPEDYEALVIELATNPAKLSRIKATLSANRLTTPLFNTKAYATHIEEAYTQMVERYRADLAPDHIYIDC